jgi:CheY-like chemotaxis protein
VLLLESDVERREALVATLRAAGLPVVAFGTIAEIEQWPTGEVVVTDTDHYTPLWKDVGATHVIVLTDTPEEGLIACRQGATAWIPKRSPRVILSMLRSLARRGVLRLK